MNKTYKYIFTDPDGKKTELKKAITDRMEPIDDNKKACAADWFTRMLQNAGYKDPEVIKRNIQEV